MSEQSNEEIRVKIGEIIGWKWHGEKNWDHEPKAYYWRLGNMAYQQLPNYPEDLNAALTLCDRLEGESYEPLFERPGLREWIVTFHHREKGGVKAEDASLARAICLAFLKVQDSIANSP